MLWFSGGGKALAIRFTLTISHRIPPNAKLIFEVELVDIDWNQFPEDISNKNLALKLNVTNCYYFKGRVNWKIQGVKACLLDLNLWEMLSPGRPLSLRYFTIVV